MDASHAAFRNLLALARADGEVCELEKRVLDRYRRALKLERAVLRRPVEVNLVAHSAVADSPQECAHVMKMMGRVALADGVLSVNERRVLTRVAESLGVGALQFADILVTVEAEASHKAVVQRRVWGVGVLLGAGILIAVAIGLWSGPSAGEVAAGRERLDVLAAQVDDLSSGEARAIAERLQSKWTEFEGLQRRLQQQLSRLESRSSAEAAGIERRLARLRSVTEAGGFKAIERRFRESVLLIIVRYKLVRRGSHRHESSSGTGFFVSPDGHIATCKHVIEPWKFIPRLVKAQQDGYHVDRKSVRIMAWPAGAEVQYVSGRLNAHTAYRTDDGSLRVDRLARDAMAIQTRAGKSGRRVRGRFHVGGNGDLAVLKARVSRPVRSLPLLIEESGIEKLDPVMALGYPTGTRILEGRRAETSPSVGVVRKIENTVFIDASIVGGNSGGPVVDGSGRVVGVATRIFGDANLGSCIRPRHLLALLPAAKDLLAAARRLVEIQTEAAVACLDLAAARQPTPGQARELAKLRARCRPAGGRK